MDNNIHNDELNVSALIAKAQVWVKINNEDSQLLFNADIELKKIKAEADDFVNDEEAENKISQLIY